MAGFAEGDMRSGPQQESRLTKSLGRDLFHDENMRSGCRQQFDLRNRGSDTRTRSGASRTHLADTTVLIAASGKRRRYTSVARERHHSKEMGRGRPRHFALQRTPRASHSARTMRWTNGRTNSGSVASGTNRR